MTNPKPEIRSKHSGALGERALPMWAVDRSSFSSGKCYISYLSAAEIINIPRRLTEPWLQQKIPVATGLWPVNELPKLNETERCAILEKLRELAHQDDEQWERIIADPRPRPKLEAFVKEALSEGSEPLDLGRL